MLDTLPSAPPPQEIPPPIIHAQECQGVSSVPDSQPNERRFLFHSSWMRDGTAGQGRECVETAAGTSAARAEITRWGRAETALLPAPFWVHLRVEPAHFDWRWRERPALALLAWEALARDPLARLRRIQVESTGTTINCRPAAITHRDIAVSALLIAFQRKGWDRRSGGPR